MKKVIKISMTVILTIILSFCTSILASASECDIKISSPDSVNVGRSFVINFSLPNQQAVNISALKIVAKYSGENLNFRSAECAQGEVDYHNENGEVTLICLFTDGIRSGDNFLSLSFTAKTGQDGSKQKLSFQCPEAVDNNLNSMSASITGSINIEITRSNSEKGSSSWVSGSKGNSSKSSEKSSAKSSSSPKASSKISGGWYESSTTGVDADMEEPTENIAESLPSIGYLSSDNGKNGYLFAGAGIGLSVAVFIFIAYKIGRADRDKSSGDC